MLSELCSVMAEIGKLPRHSKREIDRAGVVLVNSDEGSAAYGDAYSVVDAWRARHEGVVASFKTLLDLTSRAVNGTSFVASRLKRMPTMVKKLRRIDGMKLSKMQDIGGLRVVVGIPDEARELAEILKRPSETPRFRLVRPYDYIDNPKPSGYRSIHLVYTYEAENGAEDPRHGLTIELQIRSRMEHAWATANEVAGAFLGQELKSGEGDPEWLRFFELAGAVVAEHEGTPIGPHVPQYPTEFAREFDYLRMKLNVLDRLRTYSMTHRAIRDLQTDDRYFVLQYDMAKGSTLVWGFGATEFGQAVLKYRMAEREHLNDITFDTVLVKVEKLSELEAAFPNYFADTEHFVQAMRAYGVLRNLNAQDWF